MSSQQKNTNSSSSTQSSLPDGATTGENNFRCEVCGERFTREEDRNIHRSGHYNNPFRR
ncbi:unnamed protein product [Brassica napus]|uniref:(rape) hypothetical protein n=1 Tax=Brassica napus TaxID=3708 RepID=A0A816ZLZ0_BRANA|nr:unnamed protein product [Brassica napus]